MIGLKYKPMILAQWLMIYKEQLLSNIQNRTELRYVDCMWWWGVNASRLSFDWVDLRRFEYSVVHLCKSSSLKYHEVFAIAIAISSKLKSPLF